MARYKDDHGGGSDEDHDFVDLVPPPAERYDPEWRLKPPEYPPRYYTLHTTTFYSTFKSKQRIEDS